MKTRICDYCIGKGGNKGMSDAQRRKREENIKEGININKELTALTQAINALVKGRHPSYRSSALTHILQDSLGGNSKTTLLVCASPHLYNRVKYHPYNDHNQSIMDVQG